MGTSISNSGPTGSTPLLPPWAPPLDPPPGDGQDQGPGGGADPEHGQPADDPARIPTTRPPPAWSGVKAQTAKLARSGAAGSAARARARRVARNYVRSRGGAIRAARGSVAGRQAARSIGGFLSNVARSGIAEALRQARLTQYLGSSADELLAGFSEAFLPPPNTLDEAAAREAGLAAFSDLLEQYGTSEGGIEALDQLDADGIRQAIEHFIGRYICNSALLMLSKRVEDGSIGPSRCEEVEGALREVIMSAVRFDFSTVDVVNLDWNSREARQMIDGLMIDAYSMVEAE
jgi:hypothetical protein